MTKIDFSKLTNQNNTIDFSKLVDTSNTIDFSKIVDKPEEAPGYLDTLRNPLDLWRYESLPVAAYQIFTGDTKQKQAQEAVNWLANNSDKKDTEEYDQYKKIERLYGYTLDETPFNAAVLKEALQANPGMFLGEMTNALIADPYLLYPLFWEGWIAKGVQGTKTAMKIAKIAPRTVSGTARGVASVPAVSAYSSIQQLSEDGTMEMNRLATEVGLGGSAAFGMGALFAGTNGKFLKALGGISAKDLDADLRAAYAKRFGETGDRLAKAIIDDDITTDMNVIMDRLLRDIANKETGIRLKDADIMDSPTLTASEYLRKLKIKAEAEGFKVEWSNNFLYKHAKENGILYNKKTDKFKLFESDLQTEWNKLFKDKFSDFDDFLEYKKNRARIKNNKRFKDANEAKIDEEALIRTFRQKESFHKFNQAIKDEVTPWVKETYADLIQKNNRRFYHISNIVEKAETPLMVGTLLGAGGYLASGEDENFWKMATFGAGTITLGKSVGSIVTRIKALKLGTKVKESGAESIRTRLDEIKKDLPEGKTLDDLSIKDSPDFYLDPEVRKADLRRLGRAEEVQVAKGLAVSRYLLDDYRSFTQVNSIDINRVATQIAAKLGTPEREIEVTKYLQGNKNVKLTPDEIKVANDIRKIYDDVYNTFQDTELRFKFYEDYVTGFWKWNEFTDDVSFGTQVRDLITKSNPSGLKGKNISQLEKQFPSYEAGIAKGLKPQTMEISKIVAKYLNSATRSLGQRRLVAMLEEASLPGRGDGAGGIAKLMYRDGKLPSTIDPRDYVKFYHPAFLDKSIDPAKLSKQQKNAFAPYVLKEAEPLLRMLFDAKDEGSILKAISNINFLMKRFSVGYSFFHAFTLLENMMFTGMSFKEAGKTAARAGSSKWSDKKVPILSWDRTTAKTILERSGHYDDLKVATRAGVEFSHPEDIGYNRFYNMLGQAQETLDKSPIWGTYLAKQGIKYGIEIPFRVIDNITWDRVYNAGKLYAFQTATLKLLQDPKYKNVPLTKIHQVAATYTNDAYGGLNWAKMYMDTSDPVLKYIKSKAYKPSGRRLMQIVAFAPDWTTANFRIISRAFPGLNKDPMSRKLYAAYAVRAALIIGTAGMALQYMFTGTNLLANQDPTRVDLGNGMQLVLSKQFFEPLHWAVHPYKTAVSKQGMLLKTSEQLFFNKKFLTSPWPSPISKKDASLLRQAYDYGSTAGMAFVPFSLRSLIEDAMDGGLDYLSAVSWISGSLGHPIYNIPRPSNAKMPGLRNIQEYLNIK